ncbi:MAG: hypothetical protein ABI467_01860 [Kofleriaceae bacterium]
MYCSIDKIDLAARVDGKPIAVQTDLRTREEIVDAPELSVLCAMARIVNARAQLADEGHRDAAVHYVVAAEPPAMLRAALAAAGGTLSFGETPYERRRDDSRLETLEGGSPYAVGLLADRTFKELARRAAARVGVRDLAIALRMLEDQTYANPPARDDEIAYWTRVLELSALSGELLRAKYAGRWVQSDRALVPFGFQLAAAETMMFPTTRAQRVVEDGRAASLFQLLVAAEESLHPSATGAPGRLMPSLRDRRDVVLDEIVWRPVVADDVADGVADDVADDAPADLPIIVCGIDGESTFGMLHKEALAKPADTVLAEAYANLADEVVQLDDVAGGDPEARIIVVSGSFYAAEKVLDRAFMRSLHHDLGADLLAASAPARGCLLVGTITDDPVSIARFAELARERYDESGRRSISPAVLLVSDGRIAGYVRGLEDRDPTARHRVTDRAPAPSERRFGRGLWRRLFGRK